MLIFKNSIMKKIYSILGILALGTFANAQTTVLTETFSTAAAVNTYTTPNTWVTHSGTAGQILSNGSVASLLAGNSEDINGALSTSYAMPFSSICKVVYTADINVVNSTGLTTTGDYFLSLGGTSGASVTLLPARVYVKAGTTGYILGVLNNSGGTVTPTYSTTEIPYNTTTSITFTYDVTKDATTSIVQKATLQFGSETLTNSTGTSAAPANIASVVLREGGNATAGTGNVNVDNIVVKTYDPILGTIDITKTKVNLVKNTIVNDAITFGAKAANVQLVNMNGQVVKTVSVENGTIVNVSSLAKGTYIVTADVNGEKVSQKIIKK